MTTKKDRDDAIERLKTWVKPFRLCAATEDAVKRMIDARPVNVLVMADPTKILCAWCGATIREGTTPPSHGICPTCKATYFPKETT